MNLKYMLKKSVSTTFVTLWLAALLCSLTVAGIAVVRLSGVLEYEPIIINALTPIKNNRKNTIQFNDQYTVRQTFQAHTPNMSDIGLYIVNNNNTDREAVLTIELLNAQHKAIFTWHTQIKNLRADDITIIPAQVRLQRGEKYTLQLHTNGVEQGSELIVYYENDATTFPDGDAELAVEQNGSRQIQQLPGNIHFQILRHPTKWVIWDTLVYSPTGWLFVLTGIGLALTLIWHKTIQAFARRFVSPISLPSIFVPWRELIIPIIIGTILASIATAPYYTQLNKITTMGDVQRALVYRGVARSALLNHGQAGLWDPYLCGGEPLVANMESAQFDPFFLLILLFGENLGTRLSVTATLILGFVGTYVLARTFGKLERLPSLLAAGIFPFSGFQMLAFANGNFAWIPVGWIPWAIFFFLRSFSSMPICFLSALTLAFIFLGGSLHMLLYALLACGLLALFLSIFYRSARPIISLCMIVMLFIPMVAIKLLPASEIQAISGSFERPEPYIQPWNWLGKMFWDRNQLNTPQWSFEKTGENYRWIEWGSYVGIVPIILFLIGIYSSYKKRFFMALIASALIFLLMTFGEFPWTILHNLPFLYGPMRNPQRARVIFLLLLGIVAGYGLMKTGHWLAFPKKVKLIAIAIVVTLILIDLVTFHSSLYPKLFSLDKPQLERSNSFIRLDHSYTDEDRGYYKVSYENYLAGQGVTDMCMPYMMGRGIHARGVGNINSGDPYFGEAMLVLGGTIQKVDIDGDTIRVKAKTNQADWLVLNQNYFPGWAIIPTREIKNWNGLVAARITPADSDVTFSYQPLSFIVGLWISVSTLLLFIIQKYCNTNQCCKSYSKPDRKARRDIAQNNRIFSRRHFNR